jgi:hypothetical protein
MARNTDGFDSESAISGRIAQIPESDGGLPGSFWESSWRDNSASGKEPGGHDALGCQTLREATRLAPRPAALVQQEKEAIQLQLSDTAKVKMPWWMLVDFQKDVAGLEQRSQTQFISAQQRTAFYKQVMRLLTSAPAQSESTAVGWDIVLAKQLMSYAANPEKVDQGNHLTCGAAALESEMYWRSPADAARVVADVYLTRQFIPEGKSKAIVPHQSVLTPDSESNRITAHDGQRSYASQLFQGTAISVVYPGYRQIWRYNANKFGAAQTFDEVIAWQRRTKTGVETGYNDFDGLYPGQIQEMNRAIAGNRNKLSVIERRDVNIFDGMEHVGSVGELNDLLQKLKRERMLPAIAFVDSDHEPFWTDGHYGRRRRRGGGHFVCLNDYAGGAPNTVAVNNQWGAQADHGKIPSLELFLSLSSSRSLRHLSDLQRAVECNSKNGVVDTVLEFELLRRQREAGTLTSDQFSTRVEFVLNAYDERVKDGSISREEQARVADSLQETLDFENYTKVDQIDKQLRQLKESYWSGRYAAHKTIKDIFGDSRTAKWPELFNKQQAKGK